MFKLLSIFALVAVACVNAAPGALLAAPAAVAAVPAPIVTARSSQVIARNHNTYAAAPLAYTAAALHAPIAAPVAAYTAPVAAYTAPVAAYTAPLAATHLAYAPSFPAVARVAYKKYIKFLQPTFIVTLYFFNVTSLLVNHQLIDCWSRSRKKVLNGRWDWYKNDTSSDIGIVQCFFESSNMNSFVTVTIATVLAVAQVALAGVVPAAPLVAAPAVAAPVVAAPAAIGYAKAVPYNIPPYASRVDINTRNIAAPLVASAPLVAAAPAASVVAAAPAAPIVAAAPSAPVLAAAPAAPIVAAPGLFQPTYAGSLTAPLAQFAAAYGPTFFG
ncbi:calphotin-like [Polistes fuscatus]|uniref:calphotin-like n=1 Tax=Polistes fuscatus TaxID=30207 RepID=UPI001CA93A69|nr:calphotin-like [Polistes fuscatus]